MADLPSLRVFLKADTKEFQRGMRSAQRSLKSFEQNVVKMSRVATGSLIAIGTTTAMIASRGIKLAAAWEQTEVAFATMLGSGERAKNLLKDLIQFSTRTPFEPDEVIRTTKTLISFGIQARNVNDTLKMLGDISSGTGKDINELGRIFGKVFVKGKAQAEELNQFIEGGIPIMEALAKTTGKAQEEIFNLASKGEIKFGDIEKALKSLTEEGGTFFDMMQKQSETAIGKWSTLKGNVDELTKALGQRLLPVVNKALDKLNRVFAFAGAENTGGEDAARTLRLNTNYLKAAGVTSERLAKMSSLEINKMSTAISRHQTKMQETSKQFVSARESFLSLFPQKANIIGEVVRLPSKDAAPGAGGDLFGAMRSRMIDFATQMFNASQNQMEEVTTGGRAARLAGAVSAGSREAFAMRVSGRELEQKKMQKKNTDANLTTSQIMERFLEDGINIANLAVAATF